MSENDTVEIGTPQGSIISPILFSVMINDIFSNVCSSIGVSLFAGDGAMWKRGQNISFIVRKMQKAIGNVEVWALKWGFRLSVNKTKVVVFTNKKVQNQINPKLYEQDLEIVDSFKYLGIWFDQRINWKVHIEKVVGKCKKILNIVRCLK